MQPKKTAKEAYEEALKGINVKENEAVIVAKNDVAYCYLFAKDVKGANIESLQEVVIKSNNAYYCYYFAIYVKGADIEKLLEVVKLNPEYQTEVKELEEKLKSMQPKKTVKEAYEEALKDINVKENEAIILASNEAYCCYCFARDVKRANIKALQEVVIKSNDAGYCYLFARDVKRANIKALQEVAIKSNNAYCCYYFARDVKRANIKALQEVVIKSNDTYRCYLFANDIQGADIEKLLEVVKLNPKYQEEVKQLEEKLKSMQPKKTPKEAYEEALKGIHVKENEAIVIVSNNAEYCYRFAMYVEGANIPALQEVVIKSNHAYYCYAFANDIQGADIEKLLEVVKLNPNYQKEATKLSALLKSHQIPDKTSKQKDSDSSAPFVSEKKEKPMTDSNNAMDFFKTNLIKGAYAGAAASAVDNLAKGFIASLKAAGVDEVSILLAEQAMQHPIGKAFLSFLLGSGIHFIPVDMVKNNAHLQEVANMCIQNAGAAGTTVAIEGVMNFILPALLGAINNNPQLNLLQQMEASTKMRVEAPVVPEEKTSSLSDQIPNLIQFKQSAK